jgi:hypothetical protein
MDVSPSANAFANTGSGPPWTDLDVAAVLQQVNRRMRTVLDILNLATDQVVIGAKLSRSWIKGGGASPRRSPSGPAATGACGVGAGPYAPCPNGRVTTAAPTARI